MGKISVRYRDLKEFYVGVRLPFLKQQVQFPSLQVRTEIQGLLHPIRQVLPLVSHIHSCPPNSSLLHPLSRFLVHHSSIILECKVKSCLSISPCRDHECTLSTAYTEYSIHPRLPVFASLSQLHGDWWNKLQLLQCLLTRSITTSLPSMRH